jgi:hypothetical protein
MATARPHSRSSRLIHSHLTPVDLSFAPVLPCLALVCTPVVNSGVVPVLFGFSFVRMPVVDSRIALVLLRFSLVDLPFVDPRLMTVLKRFSRVLTGIANILSRLFAVLWLIRRSCRLAKCNQGSHNKENRAENTSSHKLPP